MLRPAITRCLNRAVSHSGKALFETQLYRRPVARFFTCGSSPRLTECVKEGARPLATKSTWGERVKATYIAGGKSTLFDLYSVARKPETSSCPAAARLPPLPQRVKGHPTPSLTRTEVEEVLIPLCKRSSWTVDFLLPAEELDGHLVNDDCGCAPDGGPSQKELPFLINAYRFTSRTAAKDFLADAKLLSDIGEFHHHDSYSLSPSGSLTVFVHTHSAINGASVLKPALTLRDIRYAILLDHLYHLAYEFGHEVGLDHDLTQTLDDSILQQLQLWHSG